jgi:hypothetical protein
LIFLFAAGHISPDRIVTIKGGSNDKKLKIVTLDLEKIPKELTQK